VIHDVLLVAVLAHPSAVVTVDDPLAPANGTCCMLVGEIENVHDPAFCVTVNVWPPIVIVPVRALVFGLADALNATVPGPVPVAPLVTVNHDVSLLTPVHEHPARVVTAVEPVPPPATTVWVVGSSA
jgi:hypothetical protein